MTDYNLRTDDNGGLDKKVSHPKCLDCEHFHCGWRCMKFGLVECRDKETWKFYTPKMKKY